MRKRRMLVAGEDGCDTRRVALEAIEDDIEDDLEDATDAGIVS